MEDINITSKLAFSMAFGTALEHHSVMVMGLVTLLARLMADSKAFYFPLGFHWVRVMVLAILLAQVSVLD